MVRIIGEEGELERLPTTDAAVRWLEAREGRKRGELEWVRVQLAHEIGVDVCPPVTREEYRLEHDTAWLTDDEP